MDENQGELAELLEHEKFEEIKELLNSEKSIDLDFRFNVGPTLMATPLCFAAGNSNFHLVKLFIEHGADVNYKARIVDTYNRNLYREYAPLDYAADPDIAIYLLEKGATASESYIEGKLRHGYFEFFKFLPIEIFVDSPLKGMGGFKKEVKETNKKRRERVKLYLKIIKNKLKEEIPVNGATKEYQQHVEEVLTMVTETIAEKRSLRKLEIKNREKLKKEKKKFSKKIDRRL